MPIPQKDVEVGWLYRTPNNQERVVLGCNAENQVVYASRGGNVQNAFDQREASKLETFADACSEKVRRLSEQELADITDACHASSVLVAGNGCFQKT